MMLHALYDLYLRKCAEPGDSGFAPPGREWKEIPFVFVLDRQGRLVTIEDTRTKDARNRTRAARFLVPAAVKRSVNIAANLLWDNPAYALGFDSEAKMERLKKQHAAFLHRITKLIGGRVTDDGVNAVLAFLGNAPVEQAQRHPGWPEIAAEVSNNLAFRLDGDTEGGGPRLVCERPAVVATLAVWRPPPTRKASRPCNA